MATLSLHDLLDRSPDQFLNEDWDLRPVHQFGASARFARLLSTRVIDEWITGNVLESEAVSLLRDGKRVPRDVYCGSLPIARNRVAHDGLDAARVSELYASGASLLIHGADRKSSALGELRRMLAAELGVEVAVNAILSPPGATARTLGLHYDVCGVLVLQVEGSKHWRVYPPSFELPLPQHGFAEFGDGAVGEPSGEWLLQPGDVLFVPRGHRHVVEPTWQHSLHIAVQLTPRTLFDAVKDALLEALEEAARGDANWRRTVHGRAPAAALAEHIDRGIAACAALAASRRREAGRVSVPDAVGTGLARLNRAAEQQPRYRASGAEFEYDRADDRQYAAVRVRLGGASFELPPQAEPLLERIRASSAAFCADALQLDLPARLQRQVLEALLARGLIQVCSAGA